MNNLAREPSFVCLAITGVRNVVGLIGVNLVILGFEGESGPYCELRRLELLLLLLELRKPDVSLRWSPRDCCDRLFGFLDPQRHHQAEGQPPELKRKLQALREASCCWRKSYEKSSREELACTCKIYQLLCVFDLFHYL